MAKKSTLDKDLKKIVKLEEATHQTGRGFVPVGIGILFLASVWFMVTFIAGDQENSIFIIAAGVIGGYMALNIGANDVANNVGPAVGSKALTMMGALVIAAVCEASGALIAGGDVVKTIQKEIINPNLIQDANIFILAMMAALLAAALWVNIATFFSAPVSTTHSIVGGVMGAGIAAVGVSAVNWVTMAKIAASWVISPVLGGVIAALFLSFIKVFVLFQEDKVAAARRWVPVLIAIMCSAFAVYLTMKGFKKVWRAPGWAVLTIGFVALGAGYAIVRPIVLKAAQNLENRRKAVAGLFTIPLIFSAALLSFAHGANDVANAVGPLAAIVNAASVGTISAKVALPHWVLGVGAVGISLGLLLFGPKLVRMVGERITKMDRIRAYCVALSAAITVIAASALGLPVSSTHIAVGGVFGVGFLREHYANKEAKRRREARIARAEELAEKRGDRPIEELARMDEKDRKRRLVRRQHLMTIVAAWLITVPLAALIAVVLFMILQASV